MPFLHVGSHAYDHYRIKDGFHFLLLQLLFFLGVLNVGGPDEWEILSELSRCLPYSYCNPFIGWIHTKAGECLDAC